MYFLKIAWVGDETSHKSTILRQIPSIRFQESYLSTVGSDFAIKTLFIEHDGMRVPVKLSIWDLNPSSMFREIRALFYRGCCAGIVIFDVHQPRSHESLAFWIEELLSFSGMIDMPIFLLGMDHHHRCENTNETTSPEDTEGRNASNCVEALHFEERIEQIHAEHPEASFHHGIHSITCLEAIDLMFEIVSEEALERLTDPTAGMITPNQIIHPGIQPFPTGGNANELTLNHVRIPHPPRVSRGNTILINEDATQKGLGLDVSTPRDDKLEPVPILEITPLYRCSLHRESLLVGAAMGRGRRTRWHQCRECEALLCDECLELIRNNFDGNCPNTNWPRSHEFIPATTKKSA